MGIALIILVSGIVLVAVMLVIKCPRDKIVELAEAFARWIGAAPRPPDIPPVFTIEIKPAEPRQDRPAKPTEQGQIEPPAA
jgi:hypothetical protein